FPSRLDPALRSLMEHRFRCDLGEVQMMTGQAARAAAAELGAEAYACGGTIVFRDEPDLDTPRGRWLLTHELVHIIQQRNGRDVASLQGVDADALERTATEVADTVASGRSIPADFDFGAAPYGMIQCHAGEECPGRRYDAAERAIWMAANDA